MTISETAMTFFDACETGKGADVCAEWCQDGAIFSCQADALAEVPTVADYADWMKGLLQPVPDGRYELTGFAVDEAPDVIVKRTEFLLNIQKALSVVHRGVDFSTIANDSGVLHQRFHFPRREAGNFRRFKLPVQICS